MNWRGIALASLAAALALTASSASAKAHLQARPTLVELPSKAAAARLVLANTGDQPVSAQVRVFAWSQNGGDDRLIPTKDIVLSPPITEIAAGQEQVVRLIRQGAAATGKDLSYRIVVDELPGAQATTVTMRMRYVIPLFVRAADATAPAVQCRISVAALTCDNAGGRAAQLGQVRLRDAQGHSVELSAGLFGYVLAKSQRQWPLEKTNLAGLNGSDLRLECLLNGQPAVVPVARGP